MRLAFDAGVHARAKLEGRVIRPRPRRANDQRVNYHYYVVLQTNSRIREVRVYGTWAACMPSVIVPRVNSPMPARYTTQGGGALPLYNGSPDLHPDATFHAWHELYEVRAYVVGAMGLRAWAGWSGVVHLRNAQ